MATIKERGTIVHKGEIQSGVSQNGNRWARQTIVVDVAGYNGTYRKVALQAGTQQVMDMETMPVGTKVEISYQVTAREYNGKWYNNVDLFKIEVQEEQQPQMVAPAYPQSPQYPQNPQVMQQQFVQSGMYPAAPTQPRGRVIPSSPQIPANTPMDLQDGDLPSAIFR